MNARKSSSPICFPGTEGGCESPWSLYNSLIEQIPDDVCVRDYCLGIHWSYVEADCGCGVAFTTRNGAKRICKDDLRGKPLREVAELAKSWCFEEATLGIAALNAWYARKELLDPLGAAYDTADDAEIGERGGSSQKDAFEMYRPRIERAGGNARVVVVGHFPHVERIDEYAQLTVLERSCRDEWDTPDPACEYVMPQADYAFITGVTLINKTAPRLLDLAKNAAVCMVGPSVVMTPLLFDRGVETLAGSVVADAEAAKFACKNGGGKIFGTALQMTTVSSRRQ